jgi:DNA-binding LacI/PurR family transcriptional regulator
VAEAAAASSVSTVICTGCEDFSYIEYFKNRTVDGFVVVAPAATQFNERAHIRALREAGAPFVIVNGTVRGADIPAIYYDFYGASAAAVTYLLSLGRRRIVYVDEFSEEAARELRDRREGYVDTIREAGLLPRTCDLEHLSLSDLSGAEAIVTSRAETARALMRRLLDEGVRVPAGFEILAGSGEAPGFEGDIPLTSVEFSYESVGQLAVRMATGLEATAAFTPKPEIRKGKTVRE